MAVFVKYFYFIAVVCLAAACAQYSDVRGVEVTWEPEQIASLETGKSTRNEVLALLGPPSQVISLNDETVLYYLFEKTAGEGVVLILYNRFERSTKYDRAVFFFDSNDVLTEYSTKITPEDA